VRVLAGGDCVVGQRERAGTSSRAVHGSRESHEADRSDRFHQVRSHADVRERGQGRLSVAVVSAGLRWVLLMLQH